jgi:hypothetical protein
MNNHTRTASSPPSTNSNSSLPVPTNNHNRIPSVQDIFAKSVPAENFFAQSRAGPLNDGNASNLNHGRTSSKNSNSESLGNCSINFKENDSGIVDEVPFSNSFSGGIKSAGLVSDRIEYEVPSILLKMMNYI